MEPTGPRSKRRSSRRTHRAAQFAVASELCKRDYDVALAMTNRQNADITATSPGGVSFTIDVKGLYKPNFFVLRPKPESVDLFYVLAYVPDDGPNRFFILSAMEANQAVAEQLEHARQIAISKGKAAEDADDFPCIGWTRAERFADRWSLLPP